MRKLGRIAKDHPRFQLSLLTEPLRFPVNLEIRPFPWLWLGYRKAHAIAFLTLSQIAALNIGGQEVSEISKDHAGF